MVSKLIIISKLLNDIKRDTAAIDDVKNRMSDLQIIDNGKSGLARA